MTLDNRLTQATYGGSSVMNYGYDAVGNRLTEQGTDPSGASVNKTYVYDALNRMSTMTDHVTSANSLTFGFDLNGNLQSETTAGGNQQQFTYDAMNQMLTASAGTSGGGVQQVGSYDYDFQGRRISKTANSSTMSYVYAGSTINVTNEFGSSGQLVNAYDFGTDLVSAQIGGEGERLYFHDALGSTTSLATSTGTSPGTTVARYEYDAWGKQISAPQPSLNRVNYTGYRHDDETDLEYAQARYYDSAFGRFGSFDPVAETSSRSAQPQGLDFYNYVRGNPVGFNDPTGLEWIKAQDGSFVTWKEDKATMPSGYEDVHKGDIFYFADNSWAGGQEYKDRLEGSLVRADDPTKKDPSAFDVIFAFPTSHRSLEVSLRQLIGDPLQRQQVSRLLEGLNKAVLTSADFAAGVLKASGLFAWQATGVLFPPLLLLKTPRNLLPSPADSTANLLGQLAFNVAVAIYGIIVGTTGAIPPVVLGAIAGIFGTSAGPGGTIAGGAIGGALGELIGLLPQIIGAVLTLRGIWGIINIVNVLHARSSSAGGGASGSAGGGSGGSGSGSGSGSSGGVPSNGDPLTPAELQQNNLQQGGPGQWTWRARGAKGLAAQSEQANTPRIEVDSKNYIAEYTIQDVNGNGGEVNYDGYDGNRLLDVKDDYSGFIDRGTNRFDNWYRNNGLQGQLEDIRKQARVAAQNNLRLEVRVRAAQLRAWGEVLAGIQNIDITTF